MTMSADQCRSEAARIERIAEQISLEPERVELLAEAQSLHRRAAALEARPGACAKTVSGGPRMTQLQDLPGKVVALLRRGRKAQYATLSAAGVPIDTPVLYFPGEDLRSLDLATGISYPAKAERARRNPKVGLFIEGGPEDPVISVAGLAAVRDADLQANAIRYLSEAGHTLPGDPDWALARKAVWYWTRILVEVTPAQVLWWDNPAAMDGPPHQWTAAPDAVFPQSDPAPPGAVSSPANWEQPHWTQLAAQTVAKGGGGHLSVVDAEGFPRPMSVRAVTRTHEGFRLETARGAPWAIAGPASLTFQGVETFVGEVTQRDGAAFMRVERALPVFPMTKDMRQLWEPTPETYEALMRRLRHETERRGQPIPTIPAARPQPSEGYKLRMAAGRSSRT
jgi:hypothetical protein